MFFLVAGMLILIAASFWHSYAAVALKAVHIYRPMIFVSNPNLFQLGWILLLLIGGVFLIFYHWIAGVIGILLYWFVLPYIAQPITKRLILPSWDKLTDDLKDILKHQGYNEKNYLDGNWWREDIADKEFERLSKGK